MSTRRALAAFSLVALSCHETEPSVQTTAPSVVTVEANALPNTLEQNDVSTDPAEALKKYLNDPRLAPSIPGKLYDAGGAQLELRRERLKKYPRAWLAPDEVPAAHDR